MDVIDGWPTAHNFANYTAKFLPFLSTAVCYPNLVQLRDLFNDSEMIIDVSCAPGNVFSGDESKYDHVLMPATRYIDAYHSSLNGEPNWVSDLSDLQLYLSQVPLWVSSCAEAANLLRRENFPSLLKDYVMYQCNLWVNIRPVTTTLHYDGNHNILYVANGRKTVILVSPKHTPHLRPRSAVSSSPNHSHLSQGQLEELFPAISATPKGSMRVLDDGVFQIQVRGGDALFIPEGWWHQVSSDECTFALNFWFRSPLHACLCDKSIADHMVPYVLRAAVTQLMENRAGDMGFTGVTCTAKNRTGSMTTSRLAVSHLFTTMAADPVAVSMHHTHIHQLCDMFASSSLEDMWIVWVPAAQEFPELWRKVLMALTPVQCHAVITLWERCDSAAAGSNRPSSEADSIGKLCEQLFAVHDVEDVGSRGNLAMQMRAHLVEQNNCYLVAQGTRVVNELLGLQSISDMPAKIVPFFEAAEQRSTDSEEYETLLSLDDRNKRRRIK